MSHYTRPGLGDVGSFQSSGIPFTHLAAASFTVDFEYVTRAIVVTCTDQNVGNTITFGDGTVPVHIPQGSTRFEVKCKKISVGRAAGTISLVAELTGIEARNMPDSIDLASLGTVS